MSHIFNLFLLLGVVTASKSHSTLRQLSSLKASPDISLAQKFAKLGISENLREEETGISRN
jgi:hypothetical protein